MKNYKGKYEESMTSGDKIAVDIDSFEKYIQSEISRGNKIDPNLRKSFYGILTQHKKELSGNPRTWNKIVIRDNRVVAIKSHGLDIGNVMRRINKNLKLLEDM